jgi:hypothetical protein
MVTSPYCLYNNIHVSMSWLNMYIIIQAVWRGNQVRRRSIGKKIEVIRKRVEKANKSATEENKLGNRMASALDYLT